MIDLILFAQGSAAVFLFYALSLVLIITFVVVIHELGHLYTARLFGVKVVKISIGFGREILGKTAQKSQTRWSLSLIPLGGYVELFGYDSSANPTYFDKKTKERRPFTPEERQHAFCFKPLWQRTLIVAAGPFANFLFAFIMLIGMFYSQGQLSTRPVIYAVGLNSAAGEAGLKPLDEIVSVDGKKVIRFEEIWEKTRQAGTKMTWTIRRDEELFDVSLQSKPVSYFDKRGIRREHGRIGATNFPGIKLENVISVDGIDTRDNQEKARRELIKRLDSMFLIGLEIAPGMVDDFQVYPLSTENMDLFEPQSEQYDLIILSHDREDFYVRHNIDYALWYAGDQMYKFIAESIRFFSVIFLPQNQDQQMVGGLVTMGEKTGEAIDNGFYYLLLVIVVFSVQIGFINLLPIPVLDGGYLIFFLYEAIAGQPLSERVQDYSLVTGMVLLIGIMIFANVSDFLRMLF